MKCKPSLEQFETKEAPPSLSIPEIIDSKKNWLLNCLKDPTSEDVSVNKVLAGSKYCSNHNGTTITECFHESGIN